MINNSSAYLLGILYGKGSIIEIDDQTVQLKFRVKFRRPTDKSMRADNVHTQWSDRAFVESLRSKLIDDFSDIMNLLRKTWNINSTIDLPNSYSAEDWGMKEIVITSDIISNTYPLLCELFKVDKLDNDVLVKFPFHLNIVKNKELSLNFVQGICDSCSLIPNEASSSFGGKGISRIQLEPNQERWELPIGLCEIFQQGLGIPVNNINWGHPQIRYSWKHQNHQFRISLNSIPSEIELYRLKYKRNEYHDLYERTNIKYSPSKLCPLKKKIKYSELITIQKTNDKDLNSELLDKRLRGLSIDISGKKSLIICKLLGCNQCKDYFDLLIK